MSWKNDVLLFIKENYAVYKKVGLSWKKEKNKIYIYIYICAFFLMEKTVFAFYKKNISWIDQLSNQLVFPPNNPFVRPAY